MKKTIFVAVIALTVLFAMSATAFADVELTTGNFTPWSKALQPAADSVTPHMGWTATSVKCAVCHSVHNATQDPTYSEPGAQNLLMTPRADSCTYCHITGGVSTNNPYGVTLANYDTDYAINHSNDAGVWGGGVLAGPTSYSGCSSCHSVHGANTFTTGGYATAILKNYPAPSTQVYGTAAGTLTDFCVQCHEYYTADYDTTANTTGMHVMKAAGSSFTNSDATIPYAVASNSSEYCESCHDGQAAAGFPHYQPGDARFMVGSNGNNEINAAVDQNCYGKCHGMAGTAF